MMELNNIRMGLILAVLSLFLGFFMGALFGAIEDDLKGHLTEKGMMVLDDVYEGDNELMDKTVGKSWSYMKRAHMHWGGIGGASIALILVLGAIGISAKRKQWISIMIGLGAIGYPTYWLLAALSAPTLGSTSLAKESLSWLAIPSAAFLLLGVLFVLVTLIKSHSPK